MKNFFQSIIVFKSWLKIAKAVSFHLSKAITLTKIHQTKTFVELFKLKKNGYCYFRISRIDFYIYQEIDDLIPVVLNRRPFLYARYPQGNIRAKFHIILLSSSTGVLFKCELFTGDVGERRVMEKAHMVLIFISFQSHKTPSPLDPPMFKYNISRNITLV